MESEVVVENFENKNKSLFAQIIRFIAVGCMNTAINFLILNILSYVTGITKGDGVVVISVVSFAIATTNSYFFNKYWAFKDKSSSNEGQKFTLFLLVSVVGAAINAAIVWYITNHIRPMFGLSAHLWLNAATVAATGVSLIWNFIGYKLIVFKK